VRIPACRGQAFYLKKREYMTPLRLVLVPAALVALLGALRVARADDNVAIFKLGERFFGDSLYSLALEQYQKYLSLESRAPDYDPVAYYKLAVIYYRMDDMRKAAEAFEEYISLFPSETNVMEAMFMAGLARKDLGDYKEASDLFHSVWSRFVGSARARHALFEAAQCAEKAADVDRAAELYGVFLSRFPEHENARDAALSLVMIHIDQKQYGQAEKALAKAAELRVRDGRFAVRRLYYQALLHQRMQKSAEARKYYEEMARRDEGAFPEREEAYRRYVELLTSQKEYAASLSAFEKLHDIYQKRGGRVPADFLYAWGENARGAQNYAKAAELYSTLLERYETEIDAARVRYRLAECQVGAGSFSKAIETLQELETADTVGEYAARAVLKIGDLYYGKELYPSAIGAYRRYLQFSGQNGDRTDYVLYRMGSIYKDKYQRYGAAIREFENLLKWYPSSQYYNQTQFAVAECYEKVGEFAEAIRQYEFLMESGGDEKLVSETRERVRYLKNFKMKDAESAAHVLAGLLQQPATETGAYERLQAAADVYERHLKDFTSALDVYEQISDLGALSSDSVSAYVLYRRGGVYQKLCEKARIEQDNATAEYACEQAIAFYRGALETYPEDDVADDAAYQIMALRNAAVSDYEAFLEAYPSSAHLPDVLLRIGEHYQHKAAESGRRFSDKTVEAYQRIVQEFPNSDVAAGALMGLARNYLARNELESVLSATEKFLKRFPGSVDEPEAIFLRGSVAKRQGDHQQASELYRQVLYRYPFSPFASRSRLAVAFAELATGNVFDALNNFRLYERAYPDGDDTYRARYGIAKCLLRIGKEDEAVSLMRELLAMKLPKSIEADVHAELARYHQDNGDAYAAIDQYAKALEYKKFAGRTSALLNMGELYFDSRAYDDAARAYERALEGMEGSTDSAKIMTRLINSLTMSAQNRKADKLTKTFKERFGDNTAAQAEIVYYEGVHLLVEKQYEKAINRFKYILSKFDKSERADDAAYQIALSRYYAGKEDDALKLFYKFPTSYPSSEFAPLSFFKVAMIYHGRNEFAQSAQYFEQVVSHEKTDSKTRYRAAHNAAVAYQKISAWLDAARMYDIVLAEYPDEENASSLHLKIGFCLVQGARIEEALDHFLKANENPAEADKPEILYWIGTCYAKLGEYQRAISEYLKVPYMYSGIGKWGITAEFEAARLYERLGEHHKAATLYKKIVRSDGERGRFGKKARERIDRLSSLDEGDG
jgi:TolA-binding protein